MQNILWALALVNIAYLIYALKKNQSKSETRLADRIRVLDVPESMLSNTQPVAKKISIKEVESEDQPAWWDAKIQGTQSSKSRRRTLEPEQMLLSDLDDSLS